MTPRAAPSTRPFRWGPFHRQHLPLLVLLAATVVVLSLFGATVWLVLLTEGLPVAAVLGAAVGWGAWPTVWLGLGRRNLGPQTCVSTALGLGLLGTLTLVLGVAGALTVVTAWALLVALGWGLGLARVYILQKHQKHRPPAETRPAESSANLVAGAVALLTLALPAAIALFGASVPPGVLWNAEARGYDVLEYHLQGPREYFEAGRIVFLPHNVYTSFPQQMEMLYLLLMHLAGGPLAGAIPAQLLHAACGLLAVLTLAAWAPPGWPRRIIAITAGSVPWLAYLGCLAYVELGVLLFGAVAGGLVLDHFHSALKTSWRTTLAAGLCAGLAAACKYTALLFVPAALAVAWLGLMRGSPAARGRRLALFTTGAIVALGPWLIRNAAFTGNPVYPFGYRWFDGTAWSAEQAEQWARGHRLPPDQDSVGGRLKIASNELFASRMFGPAVFVLALSGLLLGRSRPAAMLTIWFALIVAGWATLTHMPGRFVVPAVIPLGLLVATAGEGIHRIRTKRSTTVLLVCVATAGALANSVTLVGVWQEHNEWWGRMGWPLRELLVHGTDAFVQANPLNDERIVPKEGRVWLVGDARAFYLKPKVHYTVVFSRDPWLEHALAATPEQSVAWLRTQNVSHVVFSWAEIERLKRSYGFPALVTPSWVESLATAGLRRVETPGGVDGGDVELYEVLPE